MNLKKFWILAVGIAMSLISSLTLAQTAVNPGANGDPSLGTVASNLTGAADVFTGIFSTIFYVIGIVFVVASIMRYRDFRQNPVQTPISRVILLGLAGILIGFFPLIVNFIGRHV